MRLLRGPDPRLAARKYARESHTSLYRRQRSGTLPRLTVERLDVGPGARVIDAPCGSGGAFASLQDAIGPTGEIIGIDVSGAMLEIARERCARAGWENVTLIEAPIQNATVAGQADALIGCFGMDVYPFEEPLERLLAHVKPGAPVAFAGSSWAPWWRLATNLRQLRRAFFFATTVRGRRRPWRRLESRCEDFHVEQLEHSGRNHFIAWGRLREEAGA